VDLLLVDHAVAPGAVKDETPAPPMPSPPGAPSAENEAHPARSSGGLRFAAAVAHEPPVTPPHLQQTAFDRPRRL
jgi:hypothetical protein